MLGYPSYGSRREYASRNGKRYDSGMIARAWANQESESGKCPSAMTFEGAKFYSYATCIAERVEYNGRVVFLVSAEHYSSTTAQHLGNVRSAIGGGYPWIKSDGKGRNGSRIFIVPGVRTGGSNLSDSARILGAWQMEAQYQLDEAAKAREPKKTRLLSNAREIRDKMRAYAAFFELDLSGYQVEFPMSDEMLDAAIAQMEKRQAEITAKSEATREYNQELRRKVAPAIRATRRITGKEPLPSDVKTMMRAYESTFGKLPLFDAAAGD